MKTRILVVEDSKTYLALVRTALKSAGFELIESQTIWISRLVSQYRPDLVLMDVCVGGCNGASAVSALRKQSFGKDLKVLLHSSEPAEYLAQLSRECRADGYIVKTGECTALVKAIHKALRLPDKAC